MNIAETIIKQIGNLALSMVGAKNLSKGTDDKGRDFLYFEIMRNREGVKYIQIALDAGKDTYVIKTFDKKGFVKNLIDDVFCNELVSRIEAETRLSMRMA